jgi:hypothetical protein
MGTVCQVITGKWFGLYEIDIGPLLRQGRSLRPAGPTGPGVHTAAGAGDYRDAVLIVKAGGKRALGISSASGARQLC